jgi:hypothetical protein
MSTTTSTEGIRASDAEREHTAEILRAATGKGLLTLAEVEERSAACYAARYRHELAPLTADLPDGERLLADTPEARAAARRRLRGHAALVAIVTALLIVAWILSDAPFFFPIWPIAFMVFWLVRHARRVRRA